MISIELPILIPFPIQHQLKSKDNGYFFKRRHGNTVRVEADFISLSLLNELFESGEQRRETGHMLPW